MAAHAVSVVHSGIASSLMQCLPGPAPFVQVVGPVPALATRFVPETVRKLVAPSGTRPGGTAFALPPPTYRQPSPRSLIFVVPAVSESSSPSRGAAGGEARPAPPQSVVPAVLVNERLPVGMVVVVVTTVVVVVDVLAHGLEDGSQVSAILLEPFMAFALRVHVPALRPFFFVLTVMPTNVPLTEIMPLPLALTLAAPLQL